MIYRKFASLKLLPVDRPTLRSQVNYKKVSNPARPMNARKIGYKAKPDLMVVQARIRTGGIDASIPTRGRHPANLGRVRSRRIGLGRVLAQRVARRYLSHNILGYYPLAKDGQYHYYEFIMNRHTLRIKPRNWIFR